MNENNFFTLKDHVQANLGKKNPNNFPNQSHLPVKPFCDSNGKVVCLSMFLYVSNQMLKKQNNGKNKFEI